ncbi:MAG: ABC transporter ATP-binding protein [Steroidobacteraceae bacterium]
MWLELNNVVRSFGPRRAVDGLSLQLSKGSIGCLLGPSGCGKTTALRCIAGFEPTEAGEIRVHGHVLSAPGLSTPPHLRRVGMVFQDYALFPHLTVTQNVAFGLHDCGRSEREARTQEMLERVGLMEQRSQYPHQLSGGQQQRVALARALAPRPELLLLDEPFSNLDVELRERLSVEVRELLKSLNTTALLVTHDQQEAFALADFIGVMRAGRLEQWAVPYDLYHRPATRFVADFIGQGVFVSGEVISEQEVATEIGRVRARSRQPLQPGMRVQLLLRPDDVIHDETSALRGQVCSRSFRGAEFLYTLKLPSGTQVLALIPSHENREVGATMGIRIEPDHLVAFAEDEQHAAATAA